VSERCSEVLSEVQNAIVRLCTTVRRQEGRPLALLDIGCWDGETTMRYAAQLGGPSAGVEIFDAQIELAKQKGIDVARVDLESGAFPWPAASFDVVVINQVLEHLKNIWLPMSEIFRVLRPGGHAILSVPNLASLHNRVLLALGRQPTSIRTLGPHVRGYAFSEFEKFVALDGSLKVTARRGVGFYPLPAALAGPLTALWPTASHTTLLLAQKVGTATSAPWERYLADRQASGMQTFYN
jgi:methionine biosynthesis protein MetW